MMNQEQIDRLCDRVHGKRHPSLEPLATADNKDGGYVLLYDLGGGLCKIERTRKPGPAVDRMFRTSVQPVARFYLSRPSDRFCAVKAMVARTLKSNLVATDVYRFSFDKLVTAVRDAVGSGLTAADIEARALAREEHFAEVLESIKDGSFFTGGGVA